jgi:hypothetical protein
MAEKRKDKRKIKCLLVSFSSDGEEHLGISSNLSHSGLFIKTIKMFKPGLLLKMDLEVDDNNKLTLTGVVSRALHGRIKFNSLYSGIGIRLIKIPRSYRDFMQALINEGY